MYKNFGFEQKGFFGHARSLMVCVVESGVVFVIVFFLFFRFFVSCLSVCFQTVQFVVIFVESSRWVEMNG